MKKPKYWYIDGGSGWCVIKGLKRDARKAATAEYGRGNVLWVREATDLEVFDYVRQKGVQALVP